MTITMVRRWLIALILAALVAASVYFFWLPLFNMIRYCWPSGCAF